MGQVLYNASGRRIFTYPEEKDGFELPEKYKQQKDKPSRFGEEQEQQEGQGGGRGERRESDETVVGSRSRSNEEQSKGKDGEKKDGEGKKDGEKDDTIMVDWYSEDDPENPQNWYVYVHLLLPLHLVWRTRDTS